jgi:hypothetical protein
VHHMVQFALVYSSKQADWCSELTVRHCAYLFGWSLVMTFSNGSVHMRIWFFTLGRITLRYWNTNLDMIYLSAPYIDVLWVQPRNEDHWKRCPCVLSVGQAGLTGRREGPRQRWFHLRSVHEPHATKKT